MARQLSDVMELEKEIELYRDSLHLVKSEIHRIRAEYLDSSTPLSVTDVDHIDEELEVLTMTVENCLF